jgi:hypothetical protein
MRRVAVLLLGLMMAFTPFASIHAQDHRGTAAITAIDTNNFPEIHVYVSVNDETGARVAGLPPSAFTLTENQSAISAPELLEGELGVQVVFALDANAAFKTRNEAGESRLDFIKSALSDYARNTLKRDVDDVTVVAPEGDLIAHVSSGSPIVDALNRFAPDFAGAADPFAFAGHALDFAADTSPRPGMQRVLVLFSNGLGRSTREAGLTDLVARAQGARVRVYAVFVGPDGAGDTAGAQNLRTLAQQTGGADLFLEGPHSLAPIFQALENQRTQYRLSYRSTLNSTAQHTLSVGVRLTDGHELQSTAAAFPLRVTPPLVARPSLPVSLERSGPEASLAVPVEVTFPDAHPRALREARLVVNGEALPPATLSENDALAWPLAGYSESLTHTVQIRIVDELGLSAESEAVSVFVSIPLVASSAPTLAAQQAAPMPYLGWVVGGAVLLLVMAAAGLAGGLWWMRARRAPRPRAHSFNIEDTLPGIPVELDERADGHGAPSLRAARPAQPNVRSAPPRRPPAALEAFASFRLAKPKAPGKAYLEVVDTGNGEASATIEVTGGTLQIGRDADLADIVFTDRSVSRSHARLCETSPGTFEIFDEGSTSGTWVNFSQVPAKTGHLLKSGDVINLGRVQLRFRMREAEFLVTAVSPAKGRLIPAAKAPRPSAPGEAKPPSSKD